MGILNAYHFLHFTTFQRQGHRHRCLKKQVSHKFKKEAWEVTKEIRLISDLGVKRPMGKVLCEKYDDMLFNEHDGVYHIQISTNKVKHMCSCILSSHWEFLLHSCSRTPIFRESNPRLCINLSHWSQSTS